MKRAITLSAAVAAIALLIPNMAHALSNSSSDSHSSSSAQLASAEALQMVSARVALAENLNADNAKAGDKVRTTLTDPVSLKNGQELPRGTQILGVIAVDDMQTKGKSKLALNFTQAKLKDGTVVPIKATIVGVYPPESEDEAGNPVVPGDQVRNTFDGHQDGVDEISALPGVDVHSKIESNVSGVLVSTKHNVKLGWVSEIALSVAPQTGASPKTTNKN